MLGKTTIVLALFAILSLIAGPGLASAGVLPPLAGLALFAASGLLGLAAILSGGVAALRDRAYLSALVGTLGCLPLIAVTAGVIDGVRYPAINDVATDTADPPALSHAATLPPNAGRDLGFPSDNHAPIAEFYPELEPLVLDQAPLPVHKRARAIATSPGFDWEITWEAENSGGFEAVAETRLFRWKDDVAVRIRPHGEGGCVVDVRSKSREGKSDLGANARRIRRFLDAMRE